LSAVPRSHTPTVARIFRTENPGTNAWYPTPLVPASQETSLKEFEVHARPMSLLGTKTRTGEVFETRKVVATSWARPYEVSDCCRGDKGANSVAIVAPAGLTSARYSPPAVRLKPACNGAPAIARFLP